MVVCLSIPISQLIPPPLIPLATIRMFSTFSKSIPRHTQHGTMSPSSTWARLPWLPVTGVTSCWASQSGFTLRGVRIPGLSPRLSSPASPPALSCTHCCSDTLASTPGWHPHRALPLPTDSISTGSRFRVLLAGCLPSCCCRAWPPSPSLPALFLPALLSHLHFPLWHTQASFLFSGLSVSSH